MSTSSPRWAPLFQWTFLPLAAIGTLFYVVRFWSVLAAGELFHRLGWDWTMFWAQAMVIRVGQPSQMYNRDAVNDQLQSLARYYSGPAPFQTALPVAYPPWFAALILPFTVPPPTVGFALWSALSLVCTGVLVWRVKQMLRSVPLLAVCVLVLGAFAVALALFMGQVALILALAVGEMFVAFRAGRDFRAGLWLSLLLLKPQYAPAFGALIIWKWRPRALLGATLGALALVGLGLGVGGYPAFQHMSEPVADLAKLHSADAAPLLMINWRAFVIYAIPGIEDDQGVALITALSVATIVFVLALWRGKWDPTSPAFSVRFTALTLAAVATSYHSHVHGLALVIVPLAATWEQPALSFRTRAALMVAIYAPTLSLIWVGGILERFEVQAVTDASLWYVWPDGVPALLFMTAFLMLCRDLWRLEGPRFNTIVALGPRLMRADAR